MGRPRLHNTDLPKNVRLSKGKYYLTRYVGKVQHWIPLGQSLEAALAALPRVPELTDRQLRRRTRRVKVLPLGELKALQGIPPCGVYFLWRASELLYVGSSRNIHKRISGHRYARRISFDTVTALPAPEAALPQVEHAYIIAHKPPMNFQAPSYSLRVRPFKRRFPL